MKNEAGNLPTRNDVREELFSLRDRSGDIEVMDLVIKSWDENLIGKTPEEIPAALERWAKSVRSLECKGDTVAAAISVLDRFVPARVRS